MNEDDIPRSAAEALEAATARMEAQHAKRHDQTRMRAEYTALVTRRWFEGLSDEQLTVFTNLMAGLANEGENNYMTSMFYGISIAYTWQRVDDPGAQLPDGDESFKSFEAGISGMLEGFGPEGILVGQDLTGDVLGTSPEIVPQDEEDGDGDAAA
jgi:hypothetical protein